MGEPFFLLADTRARMEPPRLFDHIRARQSPDTQSETNNTSKIGADNLYADAAGANGNLRSAYAYL